MISLKNFPLAKMLGLTPDAVYERQRALTRAGYFSGAVEGKGPGSGVRATPHNVTTLLLSLLATDSLSDVVTKSSLLARAKHSNGKCPFTGETRFGRALEKILTTENLWLKTRAIEVQRGSVRASARITFSPLLPEDATLHFTEFGQPPRMGLHLEVIAKLNGHGILFIADTLAHIAAGKPLGDVIGLEDLDTED
jgi:hypothetical protein